LTWYIKGVALKNYCNQFETDWFDNPASFDFKLENIENPQDNLPKALKFSIDSRIRKKFNHLLVNNYKSLRENDESFKINQTTDYVDDPTKFIIPIKSNSFYDIDADIFLQNLKEKCCC
jgi:hypothetical protein